MLLGLMGVVIGGLALILMPKLKKFNEKMAERAKEQQELRRKEKEAKKKS